MAGERILVVEDNPDVAWFYAMSLRMAGYHVLHAADGPQGLGLAQQYRPDLIILDLMLPGIHGLDLCRLLRGLPASAETPIVVATALASNAERAASRRAGASAFLPKPFGVEVLQRCVRALLDAEHAAAAHASQRLAV